MEKAGTEMILAKPKPITNAPELKRDPKPQDKNDARRDGRAFEIPHLASPHIGQSSGGDVESGQPADTANDEISEANQIPTTA